MGGKKWCQYCRINIEYTKQAIQAHEQTKMHIRNKGKEIKFQLHKTRKQQKAERQKLRAEGKAVPTTLLPPKTQKPKVDEEKLAEVRRQQSEFKNNAMAKIHKLIAQKTKGNYGAPVEFPEENPILLKGSYCDGDSNDISDDSEGSDIRMWKIQLCPETNKPCFINNITDAKMYEKPTGFILSEEEQQLWQELLEHAEANPLKNPDEEGNCGEWEEADEPDYYEQNKASQEEEIEQLPDIKRPRTAQEEILEEIQQKIDKKQINTTSEVVDLVIKNAVFQSKQSLRQKNAKLKKLIDSNFEQTVSKKQEYSVENVQGFKPRKMVKKVQLTSQQDM